jgi:hypothetical protein
MTPRLVKAGILPDDARLIERIVSVGGGGGRGGRRRAR